MIVAAKRWFFVAAPLLVWAQSIAAADISHGVWLFNVNERGQMYISVPLSNLDARASGPIVIRLWATMDPRSTEQLSGGFLLVEERIVDGLPAGQSMEVNTAFRDLIEPPDAGQYNLALTIEEEALGANPALLSLASARLDFPLPVAPTEAEIRSRIASQIPCGAMFLPFSLASLIGLWTMKLAARRRPR